MKKGRRIMQRLLTTLLCLALCAADIIPTGITVWAQEQEVQAAQEETDTAGKEDQTNEEEIEAEEPAEDEPSVIEDSEEEAAPPAEEEQESGSEEEQESVSENTTEEEQNSVSEDTADEEANVNSVMTASEGIIASGTSNDISWVIDANGNLSVTGSGDFKRRDGIYAPWYDYRGTIKTAEINVRNMTDASYLFFQCGNLTSLKLSNFDTGNVTNMSGIFYGCESLTELDVNNFNTNSVTDMNSMFFNCKNLTTLDVSNFNTSSVTDMSHMFSYCENLTTLDVSNFDTNKVTDMSFMFGFCRNLTELDLSNFNTGSVTDMSDMFYNCNSLTTINTPRNVMDYVELPFTPGYTWYDSDDNELSELPLNLNDSVTLKRQEDPSIIAKGTSRDISWIIDRYGTLFVSGTGDYERKDGKYAPWYDYKASIETAEVTVTGMTDASYMFSDCKNLTGIYLDSYSSHLTNLSEMFAGCTGLTQLDLSSLLTDSATDTSGMFRGCENLTSLDLCYSDVSNVTDMSNMFAGCTSLISLDLSSFDVSNVIDMSNMFAACRDLTDIYTPLNLTLSVSLPSANEAKWYRSDGSVVTELPQNLSYSVALKKNETPADIASGKSNDISWVIDADRKLTVSGTGDYIRDSDNYAPWHKHANSIKTAEVTVTGMTDASYMFAYCENLTSINLAKFDTSKVTDMSYMFGSCRNLTELDVSNFDTASVTNMSGMFSYCKYHLTTLDLSSFNTGNVTDMSYMFEECSELQTLDLSNFDTGNATNMRDMLLEAFNLTTIYTPRNVKQNVELPVRLGEIWYRSDDGAVVTQLPMYNKDSILITKTKKSDPSDDDPKYDDGVLPEDIPTNGIPNGLWISAIEDQTYTGTAIKPDVRVYDSNKRLKQGTDYTLSYQNNIKAAQAGDDKPPTVVVKGKGNYAGTESKTFTITKRSISDTYVTKTFTNAYAPLTNGRNPNLVFSAKCNNKALKKNTDYTLTVKDNAGKETTSYGAVGTYTAVVKGVGNYTGEYTFVFEVLNKIPVSKLKIGKIAAVNYDGTSKTPEPVIKYGRVTLNKDTDYSLNYLNNTAIGTATIVITGKGEYFGTRNVTFSIAGLPIKKAKFTGFQTSFPYTGGEIRQTSAVLKYGDEELKEGKDYTVSYSNHRNKGKAAVTYTGIGKYTGTLKKTYSITAYNITKDDQKRIKLSTDTISAVYAKGGARPSLKVYDGTRLLTEGKDYTLTYQNNTAVTTSATVRQPTITVKGKGNYAGTLSEKKTFTITAKNIAEVTATAPDAAVSTRIGKYKSTPVLTDTNGKKLKAGTDYDRAYTYTYNTTTEKVHNNGAEVTRNAGDPVDALDIVPANTVLCVHVTAKGNYTGETTAEYRIAATLINKAKITVKNPAQNNTNLFPYTGQAIRLEKSCLTVKVGNDVLSDDQYEILESTYKNNVGKGTASVQIKGVGNYGGTATVKFKIGTKGFQWVKRLFG